MSNLLKSLNEKPIGFYRVYKRLTGNTNAALLLSQLMYWFSHKDKFYKTDSDIMEETELTKKELETAKIKLKKLPFIEVTREGIPAKTYYTINWEKYEKTLRDFVGGNKFPQKGETVENTDDGEDNIPQIEAEDENGETSFPKRGKLDSTKGGNKSPQNGETINVIQKTSSKTTSKNTLSPKSSLIKKSQPEVDSDSTEKEERRERKFLNFVNQIRERYKPDSARNFFPTILEQVKINEKGEVGKLKIDNKGHLYIKYKYELQDLSANEADRVWRWMFDHPEKIVSIKNQKKETA